MNFFHRQSPPRTTIAALLSTPLIVFLVVVVAAFTRAPVLNKVTLPVEIIGPDGYTKSVTVEASDVSQVDSLYLKAYSIGYPSWEDYDVSKASVRINGGTWTDLTDAIATCKYPESAFDCIDGPYHTIRFEVAISEIGGSLVNGPNTVDFRFNYAFPKNSPDDFGDPSTGYRILGLELRSPSDADAIDGTSFTWDDPSMWDAPEGYDDQNSVAQGEDLWNKRDLLVKHWGETGTLTAACSDCHASDGRDLAYFAFSNRSIIARSQFHGLTETEGKKIAAYIRSFQLKDVDDGHTYSPPGRPWYGVYQPGPSSAASRSPSDPRDSGTRIATMPSNGSQYAAAGAGTAWGFAVDQDLVPYLFPNGGNPSDFDIDQAKDPLYVPTPVQFADWNEWLPVHHPLDMYGEDARTWTGDRSGWWDAIEGPSSGKHKSLADYHACAAGNGADNKGCLGDLVQAVKLASREIDNFEGERSSIVEPGWENTTNQNESTYKHIQVEKWAMVRIWQTVENYDTGDEMANVSGHNSNVERYQWPGGNFPFDLAPHVSGLYAGDQYAAWDLWLDNMWYEKAARINNGRGHKQGNRPVDWQYQHGHLGDLAKHLGIFQPARMTFSLMKAMEVCESFTDSSSGTPRSWEINRKICGTVLGYYDNHIMALDNYQSGLGTAAFEIMLREQTEKMMYRHSPDLEGNVDASWDRLAGAKNGWEPASFDVVRQTDNSVNWHDRGQEPNQFWVTLSLANEAGVSPAVLDSAAAWNDAMVPDEAWDDFLCQSNDGALDCTTSESIESQSIQLRPGWNFVSSRVAPMEPSLDRIFQDTDGFWMVKDKSGQVFAPDFGIREIEAWSPSEGYKVFVRDAQVVTVTGNPLDGGRQISLQKGWNLLPYYPQESMDASTALSPIGSALRVAKDEDGNTYRPDTGHNGIGELAPGRAYAVYVTEDVSFSYPVSSGQ